MEMFSKLASYKGCRWYCCRSDSGYPELCNEDRDLCISMVDGWWVMRSRNPEGEFECSQTPWSNNPEDNKMWVGIDDCFVISSQTQHKDGSLKLMEFIANDASSKTWMSTAKLMTSNVKCICWWWKWSDQGYQVPHWWGQDRFQESGTWLYFEFSTAFRTKLQEFVTLDDSQRDVDKPLKDIDAEIASIRQ